MLETRSRLFFLGVSGVLLAVVLVGFARTFFLRGLFDVPPIPSYLYFHGAVLTAWFGIVFAQTTLVANGRTDLHRRLGIAGMGVAILVVLVSTLVVVRAVPRFVAAGMESGAMQFIVLGDLVALAIFTALVAIAFRLRRRSDSHKRLMIVSCIIISTPAIARLERLGIPVPVPAALLGLLATVVIHDFYSLGRLHRATLWSVLAVVVALISVLGAAGTPIGDAVIAGLR